MKKIISIASIGLLALAIFGCSKKTTSNTTKKKTNNNTTAVTNTKTNESTTIKTTTKNTTKITTRKTTTKQKTTTEEKKEIFTEIGYWEFREKLEAAQGTDSYNKMFVTGTIKDGNEIETYDDELYMKASNGNFHGDISKIGIEKVLRNRYLYEYGGDAYYAGDEGSLKMEVDVKISDTVEAKDVFIYNQYGLLESIKTENITTVESTELYDESVEYDIEMTYSEDDKFGEYTLISFDEAFDITNDQIDKNIYYSGTINGSEYNMCTGETRTIADLKITKKLDTKNFSSSDSNVINHFNNNKGSALYVKDGLYFKDKDENIVLSYYYNYDYCVYARIEIFYNEYGYIYKCTGEVIKKVNDLVNNYKLYNYEVEFSEEFKGITLTLDAGLGKFSDGSKIMEFRMDTGCQLYYVTNRRYSIFNAYESPTLEGASGYRGSNWTLDGMVVDDGLLIDRTMTLVALFIDSDHFAKPHYEITFNNHDALIALNNGEPNATTLTFAFLYDSIPAVVVNDEGSGKIYYVTNQTFTFTINSAEETTTIYINADIAQLIYTLPSTGFLSYGNSFIVNIKDNG